MSDKEEGGVKNIKKWVTSFMDDPKRENPDQFHHYTSIVDDFNKLEIKAYNNSFTKLAMMLSKVAFLLI